MDCFVTKTKQKLKKWKNDLILFLSYVLILIVITCILFSMINQFRFFTISKDGRAPSTSATTYAPVRALSSYELEKDYVSFDYGCYVMSFYDQTQLVIIVPLPLVLMPHVPNNDVSAILCLNDTSIVQRSTITDHTIVIQCILPVVVDSFDSQYAGIIERLTIAFTFNQTIHYLVYQNVNHTNGILQIREQGRTMIYVHLPYYAYNFQHMHS